MCLSESIKKSQDFIDITSKRIREMTSQNAPHAEIIRYKIDRAWELLPMLIEVEKLRANSQFGLMKSRIHWISLLFLEEADFNNHTGNNKSPIERLDPQYVKLIGQLREKKYQSKLEQLTISVAKLMVHINR